MKKWIGGSVLAWTLMVMCGVAAETAPTGYLEPAKPVAWWRVGDTAKFRLLGGGLPEGTTEIEGILTNVDGDEVTRVKVNRADFESKGWQWKPTVPGYYEVEFIARGADKKTILSRPYVVKAKDPKGVLLSRTFTRDRQGMAILPAALEAKPSTGQFGFDYGNNPEDVLLAKYIGFDFARLDVIWGDVDPRRAIEPVKGQYNWDRLDAHVDLLTKSGIQIMAQFTYTPLWASPHPEKKNVNICVVEATAYAPVNTEDFSQFVDVTVNRYKDRIHNWEIWNEPSIPGGSVYWSDTTENYFRILKAGYTAIKKVQPDSVVSLGGLGPRKPYHAFYNRLLKMDASQYWDVLSLHGAWNSPEDYREIDARYNVASKPAITTEWHAILQGNMQADPILPDTVLSFKMMKDLLYQFKVGVTRVLTFEMLNLTEKEVLPFAIENKWFTHASGLFRRLPQVEPRQPGVVLSNFIEVVGRKATYVKEFKLSDESIALQLDTARGPMIVFWGETGAVPEKAIKPFLQSESQMRDWEGRSITVKPESTLAAKKLYYILAPNIEALTQAPVADKLVYIRKATRSSQAIAKGTFVLGKLFSSVEGAATVPDAGWIQSGWNLTKLQEAAHDSAFSVRSAVGLNDEGIDIVVEVKDKTHSQKEPQPAWWNGDSLQFALDCEGSGFTGGNTAFVSALTESGPVLWKLTAADPRGDIPAKWSPANGIAKNAEQKITHSGDMTRYQIRIPWSELYPMTLESSKVVRMSFAVNNNNGSGRAEYLDWGGGITKDNDPANYGQLTPLGK